MNIKEMVQRTLIFKTIVGSKMYGTVTKDSDTDYIGICIPDKDFILGTHIFEQLEERTNPSNTNIKNTPVDNDCTTFSLQKFIKLASDNNPNIIEIFFAPDNCIKFISDEGLELINNRDLFISKKLYYKFSGYANAQFRKLLSKEPIGLRSEIVKKYGFDVKFGHHLIRLYYMGIELLKTGKLVFPTEQYKYLIQIKKGEWPFSAIIDKAFYLKDYLDECFKTSQLREIPDFNAINKLQIKLIEQFWEKKILPLS